MQKLNYFQTFSHSTPHEDIKPGLRVLKEKTHKGPTSVTDVKCLQKTVKDSYHIMCRPCACELEVCAKCGKKEDIVIPFNKEPENFENNLHSNHQRSCRRNEEESDSDLDFNIDLDDNQVD
ncbi:hypothetical protein HPG69_007721 [Diceros bicornis minor]|uniref:Uncharacterized protein n=1 Tax=Diceros bicornis minor TaxID=77932 RepID=A0A7J7EAN6_DICBM|nr:hypothetical protein HPG69_007721 [Diceros bicornis minor]